MIQNNKRNYLKERGITLIALVITIVVLLILAAVSINAMFGENGLLKQVDNAREKTEIAEYIDDLNRKVLEAQMNTANDEGKILEETKRLVAEDEKYSEAIISEIDEDNKFTVITKEGYKIDVTKDGATYIEKVTEEIRKVKLTVKHINKSGTELKATTEVEYNKNKLVTVKSETISGYETYSAKITATEVNETLTEGAPVELSFKIYMDTEVIITYDVEQLGDAGQSGGTQKEYEEKPRISNTSEPITLRPIEKNSNIQDNLPEEIKNSDDKYTFDMEPVKSGEGPLTITLDVSDKAEDGDTANVRHYKNSIWDNLGNFIVNNGKITFTVDSFSPFCITIIKQKKNPVYATLYTDGTLAFSNDNSEISGKTVVTKYGDISKLQLRESKVVDNINETEYHHPWLNAYGITEPMSFLQEDYEQLNTKIKNAIKNITFVNKVSLNSTAYLFTELTGVTEISNLNYLDTSNVRDMSYMFGNCESLEKVEFNVLNTSRVTNMEGLFQGCIKLEEINMNGINTENVTDMSGMFCWCISLKKLDLSSFNTSNVTDMSSMFGATKVLMDLSKFDTKNVTDMSAMFSGYQGTYLDLASFDTNKVTDFHNMFDQAIDLKHIIVDSGWNVSNQADVDNMFYSCGTNTVTYKKDIDTTITLNDYGFSNNHVYTEVGKGTTGFLFKPDKTIVAFSNGADKTAYFMQEFQASRMYWDVQNGKVVVVIEKTNGDSVILPVETSNNGRTITTINPFTQAQAEYYITLENYHEIYTGKKYNITMSGYAGQYIIVNSDNTITLSSGLEQAGATATYLGQGCMIITLGSNTVYIATSIDGTKLLSTDGTIGAELEN